MSKQLQIKLVKSLIGRLPKHIEMVRHLGLKKTNTEVVRPDNPAVRGVINIVGYLLSVKEL